MRAHAPPRARPTVGRAGTIALAAALLGAGCAPRPTGPASPAVAGLEGRYLRALETRVLARRQVEADITLWARLRPGGRLPGGSGTIVLTAPDGLRLRVASLFGTALDVAVRGDSVVAVVPAERLGLMVDAARDTLGLALPGAHAYRLMSGSWRPPDGAWARATRVDSLLEVRWPEGEDTLRLAIGGDGLPRHLSVLRPGGGGWRVEYLAWTREAGAPWPASIRCAGDDGRVVITGKLARVRFRERVEPARLAVRVPADTELLDWRDFRDLLTHAGAWLR